MGAAKKLCGRALALMDPPDPIFDELRALVEKNRKLFASPKTAQKKKVACRHITPDFSSRGLAR